MNTPANSPTEEDGDITGYLLLHVFVGPAIGLLAVALLAMPSLDMPSSWSVDVNLMSLLNLIIFIIGIYLAAWFVGFIPALLTALVMVVLFRLVRGKYFWLSLTPLVGWLVVFVPILLISGDTTPDVLNEVAKMALIGSVAAVGCQVIAWRRQMHPVRRRQLFGHAPATPTPRDPG